MSLVASDAGVGRASSRRVGLVDAPRRTPRTPVEALVLALLERGRTMPFEDLVQRTARALYVDALRHGAGNVDIGVFGAEVFVPDVVRELEAGDRTLWEIEPADRVP